MASAPGSIQHPELFFILRGVDMQELVSAASAQAAAPIPGAASSKKRALAEADLAGIFGVELDATVSAVTLPAQSTPVKPSAGPHSAEKMAKTPAKQAQVSRYSAEQKRALLRTWHAEANKMAPRSKARFCRDVQLSVITLNKWLVDASPRVTASPPPAAVIVHDTIDVDVDNKLKEIRGHRDQIAALRVRLNALIG